MPATHACQLYGYHGLLFLDFEKSTSSGSTKREQFHHVKCWKCSYQEYIGVRYPAFLLVFIHRSKKCLEKTNLQRPFPNLKRTHRRNESLPFVGQNSRQLIVKQFCTQNENSVCVNYDAQATRNHSDAAKKMLNQTRLITNLRIKVIRAIITRYDSQLA